MEGTKLQYYYDSYQFEDVSVVTDIVLEKNDIYSIILDQTIMYPQGGGQPYDKGIIFNDTATFLVEEVRSSKGFVLHMGRFSRGKLNTGDAVKVQIDETRRRLNAKLHSVGHLIDHAIHVLGYNWQAVKGYHFPEGAYVEYRGALSKDNQIITQAIQEKVSSFIRENTKVKTEIVQSAQVLKDRGLKVPAYLPIDKPVRVVTIVNAMPCGGTHVKELAEIGSIIISKVKMKEGNIRICYQLEERL